MKALIRRFLDRIIPVSRGEHRKTLAELWIRNEQVTTLILEPNSMKAKLITETMRKQMLEHAYDHSVLMYGFNTPKSEEEKERDRIIQEYFKDLDGSN